MRFVPKIYQLFLASNVIVPFLVSSVFFVAFLMTFEMFRILQLMSSDEVSFGFVMGLMGDVAITLVPMAIPLSVFFSVIFSLGRMSGDSEYVALRAAGLPKEKDPCALFGGGPFYRRERAFSWAGISSRRPHKGQEENQNFELRKPYPRH